MIGDFLKDSIQVLRPSRISDGGGAFTTIFPQIADTFGYLEPASSVSRRIPVSNGIQLSPATHRLYVSGNEDIKIKDRIINGSLLFEVVFVGDFRRYKEVEINQIYGQQ